MLHVLATYHPAFSAQQHADATIAVAWMRPGQGHNALMKLLLVGGHRPGKVVIGRTRHPHITTGPSHRTYVFSNDMHYGRFFVRRAYHFTMFKVKYNLPHCAVVGTQSTIRGHQKLTPQVIYSDAGNQGGLLLGRSHYSAT